jgi:hypothetical protein
VKVNTEMRIQIFVAFTKQASGDISTSRGAFKSGCTASYEYARFLADEEERRKFELDYRWGARDASEVKDS